MKRSEKALRTLLRKMRTVSADLQRRAQQLERILSKQARPDERDAIASMLHRIDEDDNLFDDVAVVLNGEVRDEPDDGTIDFGESDFDVDPEMGARG